MKKSKLLVGMIMIAFAITIAGVLAYQSISFHQNLTFPTATQLSGVSVSVYVYDQSGSMHPISDGQDLSMYWKLVPPQTNIGYSYTLPIAIQNNGITNANVTLTVYNLNTTIWNPHIQDIQLNPDGSITILAGQLLSMHFEIHENSGFTDTHTGDFTIGISAIQTP